MLGIASAVVAGLLDINSAAELTNIGILLAFVLVIVLRYQQPELPRGFRCPGMPLVPIIGIGFSIWLISFLERLTYLRFGAWFLIGAIIYLSYSRRHSRMALVQQAGSEDSPAQRERP